VALSRTIEAVLEQEVLAALGCCSVALVDPSLKTVPLSPRYIAADNMAWQDVIDTLLRRAMLAVVILPPGQRAREALRWEVLRAIEVSLLGRLVFVLPPPDVDGYASARKAFDDLQSVLPGLERAPKDSIVVYPHSASEFEWFFVQGIAGDATYRDAFRTILGRVNSGLLAEPFEHRYPYRDRSSTKQPRLVSKA
jgi:hypothetical protein